MTTGVEPPPVPHHGDHRRGAGQRQLARNDPSHRPDPVAATPGMSPNHPGRALSLILAALLGQSPPRRRSCCTSLLSSLRSSVASAPQARRPSWPSGCATAVRRANWRRKSDVSMVTCPAAETAAARLPHTTPYRESCSSEVWEITPAIWRPHSNRRSQLPYPPLVSTNEQLAGNQHPGAPRLPERHNDRSSAA